MQLSAFVSMNVGRHVRAHRQLFDDLANGAVAEAASTKAFYDEYFAVLDMPADFYLETVNRVFQEFLLARGLLTYEDRPVDPAAIRRTALFTVEGERDDICAVGQTVAAHDLCTSVKPARRRHHLQAGVGHYGVFSGRRWQGQIYPLIRNVILAND
jgi:polyhydroxyalkanoate depolymerase